MSTPSHIIARRSDGKYARIDCHLGGYLSHNGRILLDHYPSQDKIDQLMALGHLRALGAEIGSEHPFDSPVSGSVCDAYGRDGGQTGTGAQPRMPRQHRMLPRHHRVLPRLVQARD